MSYVLHLWREPIPTSLTQAEALLPDLRHQLVFEPDPRARTLVEGIAARLPRGHDPEDYWNELPDAEPASPLVTLSPCTAELDTVLPILLDVAREQGWVVHDGQVGESWLPDGRVLRRVGSFPAPTLAIDKAHFDSPAARATWLRKRLAPLFEHHGFRSEGGEFWFSKSLPFGKAVFYGHSVRAGLDHGLWLKLDYPEALHAAVDSDGGPGLRLALHRLAAAHGLAFTYNEPPAIFMSEPPERWSTSCRAPRLMQCSVAATNWNVCMLSKSCHGWEACSRWRMWTTGPTEYLMRPALSTACADAATTGCSTTILIC